MTLCDLKQKGTKIVAIGATASEKYLINKHVEATCLLVVQHIKNVMKFQNEINRPLGFHSRLMERMFHPEDILILKGTSKQLYTNPYSKSRKEHIVPMNYLLNELWRLIEEQRHTDEMLAIILKNHLGVAYITHEEAQKLDSKISGLKANMPTGWRLGIDDPLERLQAVDIVLLDEHGQEVHTLRMAS